MDPEDANRLAEVDQALQLTAGRYVSPRAHAVSGDDRVGRALERIPVRRIMVVAARELAVNPR